jgi:outer membrane lipoprotein-sorting protein
MTQDQQGDEILERAVQCLRNVSVPAGPPQALIQTLLDVNRAEVAPKNVLFRKRMLAAAAAIVVLAVGAIFAWLLFGPPGQSIAYAEVRSRILSAKAISFKANVTLKDAKPKEMRAWAREGGHLRCVGEIQGHESTIIVDFSKGKFLTWRGKERKAYLVDVLGVNKSALGENWLENLQKSLGDWADDLGEKDIVGRRAKGFRTHNGEFSSTVWIDAKTKDLLLAENSGPGFKAMLSDFQMDPKLEADFFELKAPDGYAIENQKYDLWSASSNAATQSFQIEGLRPGALKELADKFAKEVEGIEKASESPAGQQINALALLPPDEGFPGLIKFMGDKDEAVRMWAASVTMGYARTYRNKAVYYFGKALESQDSNVIANILLLLNVEIASPYRELIPKVRSLVMDSKDFSRCIVGLMALKDFNDIEGITRIAKDHPLEKVRASAARSLQWMQHTQPTSKPGMQSSQPASQP